MIGDDNSRQVSNEFSLDVMKVNGCAQRIAQQGQADLRSTLGDHVAYLKEV